MDETETVKISMTITKNTREWLIETYPDAQSVQEALRMSVSDARKQQEGATND